MICLIISFRLGILNLGARRLYKSHKFQEIVYTQKLDTKLAVYLHIGVFLGKGSIVSIRFSKEVWDSKYRLRTTAVRSKERLFFSWENVSNVQ